MREPGGLAARLFEQHGRSVRQYLRALTGSGEQADDLSQEVFLRVVRGAERYEPRERERAWLLRIARNLALDARRRAGARLDAARPARDVPVAATQSLRLTLREALAQLPSTEREAFLMAEIGGLSYAEIAAALDLSVAAVRSCLYRARLALRAALPAPAPGALAKSSDSDQNHDN